MSSRLREWGSRQRRRAAIGWGAYGPVGIARYAAQRAAAVASGPRRLRRARAFYREFIAPGSLCFDVGANVGDRSRLFLDLGARVVAVEPQKYCAQRLRSRFRGDRNFALVNLGLAETRGVRKMRLSAAHSISSMSDEFIAETQEAGRFAGFQWDEEASIEVTTLDDLIAKFGMPAFCKIDVEGFELQVLHGLNQPLPSLSFEFTPELFDVTAGSVAHLVALGDYQFNFSLAESFQFNAPGWRQAEDIVAHLSVYQGTLDWGDVYARIRRP